MTPTTRTELTLQTSRLRLESLQRRHGPLLFAALSDPSIYTYIPVDPPASITQLEARFEQLEVRQSPDGLEIWLNWAIYYRPSQGYAGLVQATVRPEGEAMLAYELTQALRGQGIAQEACAAVIAELAGHYGVVSLLAYVDTRNTPSLRLLERLGFSRVETILRADFFKDAWSDEFVYRRKVSDQTSGDS
jgi:RimJ/RimL family protein N-acetyltransferase